MRIRRRWITTGALLATLLPFGTPVAAQQLTVERIFGSPDFRTRGVSVEWMKDGESIVEVQYNADTQAYDVWVEGIRTGKRTRLVEGTTLRVGESEEPLAIEDFSWSPDESKLLFYTDVQPIYRHSSQGTYYVYDLETEELTPLSSRPGGQMFAKFSPGGDKVGFVRDKNLFVVDLATGRETQLTHDGGGDILNGVGDWVYEEELVVYDAWRWSPDGERIAYWRFDQSPVGTFYMVDELDVYSEPLPLRYPKAGTANSRVRAGVVELANGRTTWLDVEGGQDAYIARLDFAASPTEVVIQRLNRHQNRLDVLLGDARTGETRLLFSETDSAWVDVDDELTWLRNGRQFLWTSERDGYNHIYLYDRSGKLVRQLTEGDWEVSEIDGVDEKNGWVYFTAANPDPLQRQFFRVRLNGRGLERLTQEPGTHAINLSPTARLYVESYSRSGVPPVYRLRQVDGTVVRVLQDNARVAENLNRAGVRAPEFFTFSTSDGVELNGWMIKPQDFDPNKRYPVLMYVYGGPGSQTVTDAWGGNRYLWHQLLAERGYLVVSVDNRGTGGRGRDFKKITYLNLGDWETRDQIEAARYLASLPYVDEDRIGIWGWSYGGYMTSLTLMRDAGELFKAGISVAPVTHWGLYDTIYTERYMRTPQENPEGYRQSSPLTHVGRLESDFLLVHGTGDDNVHFQNSVQLANALQAAGEQFEFMLYPNRTHSISGGNTQEHLFRLLTDWVQEHL